MPPLTMEAFFLPVAGGRRFCLFDEPAGPLRGALLFVHAFADEMNLSRHMVTLQRQALVAAGFAVLQIDLFGCGDSDGDHAAADWSTWCGDIVAAAHWLQRRTGRFPAFWGMRAGCLLAAAAARQLDEAPDFLFWQPVLTGAAQWRQFQRLQLTAECLADAAEAEPAAGVTAGEVDIAGYRVAARLSQELQAARLDLPPLPQRENGAASRVVCIEVRAVGGDVTPALASQLELWRGQGWNASAASVMGPSFWQIAEADDCLALIAATLRLWTADHVA